MMYHICCRTRGFCITLYHNRKAACITCISAVSDEVIQEKPMCPKASQVFVSLVSYKFSGSMEVLYRGCRRMRRGAREESNSTSDTVIQVLQRFCRGAKVVKRDLW